MENLCLFERFSKAGIGLFFLLISLLFVISGLTVLPMIGFLVALPFFLFSIYFFRAKLNRSCQIKETAE